MLIPPDEPLHQLLKLIGGQIKNIAIRLFWLYDYSALLGSAGIPFPARLPYANPSNEITAQNIIQDSDSCLSSFWFIALPMVRIR